MNWMGENIYDLDDKRLWNIIQAMGRGTWAGGKPCRIGDQKAFLLYEEYHIREARGTYSTHNVEGIEAANAEWEAENNPAEEEAKVYPPEWYFSPLLAGALVAIVAGGLGLLSLWILT